MNDKDNEIKRIEEIRITDVVESEPVPSQPVPTETVPTETVPTETVEAVKSKKLFSRETTVPFVPVQIVLPEILVDYEPFVFNCRFSLTKEASERKQEYLSLSVFEMERKENEQALDELCDLLITLPSGFSDLKMIEGQSPGVSFRHYVEHSPREQRDLLDTIVAGAIGRYWSMVSPRIFRA